MCHISPEVFPVHFLCSLITVDLVVLFLLGFSFFTNLLEVGIASSENQEPDTNLIRVSWI